MSKKDDTNDQNIKKPVKKTVKNTKTEAKDDVVSEEKTLSEEIIETSPKKPAAKKTTRKKKESEEDDNSVPLNSLAEKGILDFLSEVLSRPAKEPRSKKKRTIRRNLAVNAEHNTNPILMDIERIPNTAMRLAEIPKNLPVLCLKDNVVFNSMILPIYETRDHAIEAIDAALASNRYLFICTQKSPLIDQPTSEDLYEIGTVVMVLRMIKSSDSQVKILVQGLSRAKALKFSESSYMSANIELLEEIPSEVKDVDKEALIRAAREQSENILSLRGIPAQDIMPTLQAMNDPGKLADIISANMRLNVEDAQSLLECLDPIERLRKVNQFLTREVEVATMQSRIQGLAREGMDKAQREYYLREQLKAIRTELGDTSSSEEEIENLKEALNKAGLPADVKKEADKQLKRLSTMHNDSAEAGVIRTYLDWIVELPWKKSSKDVLDIAKAKRILDQEHYGLEKIKDRILEFLSVRKLKPDTKGSILCFAGPPGVGKTSLGKSIAHAMGRKFQRISLGGTRDEAEIRGHRRTYIGAMPGRIIQALKQAGTRNPVILLDEIDKLANDFRGDPASALLEVLDPEQNVNFSDHYMNVPYDLSKVLFICTANHLENIPSALRDRFEIINLAGYTEQEKLAIAKKYILPRQVEENGLKPTDVRMRDNAITKVIHEYTREAGLRNLERELGSICRKLARKRAEGEIDSFNVNPAMVNKLLGIPRFLDEEQDKVLPVGVAQGLAWTQAGGEVLYIEVSTMKGKGALTLTGQLGDVMKESATAAMTYARAHADEWGIDPDFHEKLDIHVHVPAGATPKDGPSAGVTMVTALISALSGKNARADFCMTGEMTLRGRVLPVGGIKEKILAGVARGLTHAAIPYQNTKDIEEIPADLRKKIEIHTVSHIDELLPLVFEKPMVKQEVKVKPNKTSTKSTTTKARSKSSTQRQASL